jgi:hypothetical protein
MNQFLQDILLSLTKKQELKLNLRWSLQDRVRLTKIIVQHDLARLFIQDQARSSNIDLIQY